MVEEYLAGMVAHNWDRVTSTLAASVVRVGPFGDTFTPREPYVAFLRELMPKLPGYSMEVRRVVAAGSTVVAELTESVEVDGAPLVTPEALVFDLDGDGRIAHVAVYLQRLGDVPSAPG